jgi:hypothetical protein
MLYVSAKPLIHVYKSSKCNFCKNVSSLVGKYGIIDCRGVLPLYSIDSNSSHVEGLAGSPETIWKADNPRCFSPTLVQICTVVLE